MTRREFFRSERGPARGLPLAALLLLLAPLVAGAADEAQQAGESVRIGTILLDVEDVYPEAAGESVAFPYSMANVLHLRTRAEVVRRELLFAEGDVYRPELLAETERNLRRFRFLRHARVEASEPRGGRVDVRVHTIDSWTTKLQLNVGSAGGTMTGSAGVVEDNLLGLGKSLSAYYVVDSERTSVRFAYSDPRVLGRPYALTVGRWTGAELDRTWAQLVRPFSSTLTTWSYGATVDRSDLVEYLYEAGEETLRFRQARWRLDAFVARSVGSDPTRVRRVRLGWRLDEDRFAPAQDGPALPESFEAADRRFSGPVLGVELRQIRFVRERNINTYLRDEDFNLGTQLVGEAGYFPEALGSQRAAARLSLAASRGLAFGPGRFALGTLRLSGRLESDGLRDGQATAQLDAYGRLASRLTLAMRLEATWLHEPDPEVQYVLGGEQGLRGYKLRYYTGDKGLLGRLEARFLVVEDLLKACSIAATLFADAGNAWGEGRAMDPLDVHADLGAGLRISFPRSSQARVLRLDLSYALDENGLSSPWLFSFGTTQSF